MHFWSYPPTFSKNASVFFSLPSLNPKILGGSCFIGVWGVPPECLFPARKSCLFLGILNHHHLVSECLIEKKKDGIRGMYPLDSHDCFLRNPASQGFLSSLNLESGALGGKLRFKERVQDRLTGRPVHQSVCSCKGVGGKGIPSNELVDVCI